MAHSSASQGSPVQGGRVVSEQALLVALQENFQHARHEETLRERQNYLYWLAWGAILGFALARPQDTQFASLRWLFFLLTVFSALVPSTTLKWTAEFANHISAAYEVARVLNLNKVSSGGTEASTSKFTSLLTRLFNPLPYGEFVGYMAMPLKMPMVFNVGPAMSTIQALGLAASTGLFFLTFWSGVASFAIGFVLFSITEVVCAMFFVRMTREVSSRRPYQQ